MAGEYVTISDITNVHIKQFDTDELQAYVDESNTYYEDFAITLGITPDLLEVPVAIIPKRMLCNYITMRVAEDSIGTNSVALAEGEDMYVEMRATYEKLVRDMQSKITPELLTGQVYTRSQRSYSCGKIMRS